MKASTKAVGLLLLVLLAVPASAQTLVGSVTGKVTDEQGAALPGVSITLTGKTGSKTTVSEADGTYRFQALDPGTYAVQADMTGFATRKQESVVITVGKQATVDFALKVRGPSENI